MKISSNLNTKSLTLGDLSNTRNNNFDFIRLLLSFCVIITHSYIIIDRSDNNELFLQLTRDQISIATLAVNYFFVISGFLICASWINSKSTSDYFRKRILRIYPAFIVVVLFTIFVVGPLGTTDLAGYFSSPNTYKFFIRQIFFHKDPLLYGTLNNGGTPSLPLGSVATLRYEVAAYIMVAVMGMLGLFRNRYIHIVLLVVAIVVYNTLPNHVFLKLPFFGSLGGYMTRLATYFLSGLCFYMYRDLIPHNRPLFFGALALLVGACIMGQGLHWILPICATYLLFYFAYSRTINVHNFAKYGDFSYGVFLYGYPVQQLLWYYFPNVKQPMLQAIVAMIISCGFAALSWHFVEKPFLRLKSKRNSPTVVATAVSSA